MSMALKEHSLLDQERKQELILAKQVRQGTVVVLGGNLIKVHMYITPNDNIRMDITKTQHGLLSSLEKNS